MTDDNNDSVGRNEACSFCGKSAESVQRLIQGNENTFICDECVSLCHSILQQDKFETEDPEPLGGIPTPAEIKEDLEDYVVGQEKAKKTVSVAVHNHYKRLKNKNDSEVELDKSNVLLVGPSGCGKTLIARVLAQCLDVPFAIADATTLTEAGYVGEDVENVLLKLIQAADFDVNKAQQGIIYVDEIDKIGKTNQNRSITRDVSGEGVQQSLLKMLEGTVANVPPHGGRKHPEEKYIQIDTTDILFICGGSFDGIEKVVAQRTNQQSIGFKKEGKEARKRERKGELLKKIVDEDLIKYGMIPEMVGRLPVIAPLTPLSEDDLVRILLEPKDALVKQYKRFFELEDAQLEFTDEGLREIAKIAMDKDTGARGLRSALEEMMLDPLFDLPSKPKGYTYVVSPEVVKGEKPLLEKKYRKGA
jgi:ATP-dependent Clp protease ATP-binding subunit ClpX